MTHSKTAAMIVVGFALLWAGCSHQPPVDSADAVVDNARSLPFDRATVSHGISPTAAITPASIPAGTPITVRLQSVISSASSQSGDAFDAVLDEPIIIDGQTVVLRGASIAGKVVAARASGRSLDPGYLRLALTALSIDGKSRPVQTSSIFVKGGSHQKRNLVFIGRTGAGGSAIAGAGGTGAAYATGKKDVGFSPEKRLTFRLAQQVDLKG
jgi:hypothetical protein